MESLEERHQEALTTAEIHIAAGRFSKAAEFLLESAFYGDDTQAYQQYIRRGQVLEASGLVPSRAYRAAYECAMGSIPPCYLNSLEALFKLAEAYSERGRHEVSKAVLRDAQEILFAFKEDYGWDDSAEITQAQTTLEELHDRYSNLFDQTPKGALIKATVDDPALNLEGKLRQLLPSPDEGWTEPLPAFGID
jgi:tetratricopeptide (TPR) repeat protein